MNEYKYETDWWAVWRDIRRDTRFQGLVVAVVLAVIITAWVTLTADNSYTTADCIRQWHDVGVYSRAEELCSRK